MFVLEGHDTIKSHSLSRNTHSKAATQGEAQGLCVLLSRLAPLRVLLGTMTVLNKHTLKVTVHFTISEPLNSHQDNVESLLKEESQGLRVCERVFVCQWCLCSLAVVFIRAISILRDGSVCVG